jgi:succinate dehydrogenase / fumarate reductase, membrane anchor subunit
MSLRTPLARARGLGSAKSGFQHWWHQRLTAAALVALTFWFVYSIASVTLSDYQSVVAWMRSPVHAAGLVFIIVALFYHAALGIQVVIEDYVHIEWLKIGGLLLVQFVLALLGLIATIAVIRVSLGS